MKENKIVLYAQSLFIVKIIKGKIKKIKESKKSEINQ